MGYSLKDIGKTNNQAYEKITFLRSLELTMATKSEH